MKKLESISSEKFSPYGWVLEFSPDTQENFEIVVREESAPWRLAVYRYEDKAITKMECHPNSMESFEPLQGITVLMVAEHERPNDWQTFLLDKPICLKKGVWHQVLALTPSASVKIAENLEVSAEFHTLSAPVAIVAAEL